MIYRSQHKTLSIYLTNLDIHPGRIIKFHSDTHTILHFLRLNPPLEYICRLIYILFPHATYCTSYLFFDQPVCQFLFFSSVQSVSRGYQEAIQIAAPLRSGVLAASPTVDAIRHARVMASDGLRLDVAETRDGSAYSMDVFL